MAKLRVPIDQEIHVEPPPKVNVRTYVRKKPEIIKRVKELCRLCLERDGSVYIFEKKNFLPTLVTKIVMCVGIEMQEEESLPTMICKRCKKCLENSFRFRKRCELNYIKLKSHIRAVHIAQRSEEIKLKKKNKKNEKELTDQEGDEAEEETEEQSNKEPIVTVDISNDCMIDKSVSKSDNLQDNSEIKTQDQQNEVQKENLVIDELNPHILESGEADNEDQSKRDAEYWAQQPTLLSERARSNIEEELKELILTTMEEYNVMALDGGYIEFQNGVPGVQLLTADGALLTLQLSEEDPETNKADNSTDPVPMDAIPPVEEKSKPPHHRCGACHKSFSSRAALKRHMLVHGDAAPHRCRACGRGFKQRAVLLRHMLVHEGSRPHACSRCPKSFTQRGALLAHERSHAAPGARALALHRCGACDKVFLHMSGLSRHQREHAGARYSCASCGRRFLDRSSCKRHAQAHGPRPPPGDTLHI